MASSSVEQIKARLSTFDVVGSYIKLLRAGTNFKAVCPFHSEKTPSFFVSPARDTWHCFGCSRGGDQFRFVMDIEGIDFKEALEILAGRAGVALKPENVQERSERNRLFSLMEEAAKFYQAALAKHPEVLLYLKERKVSDASVQSFRLGYSLPEASGWRTFLEHARQKGYSEIEVEQVGLAIKNLQAQSASSRYYDRFRNRIMFPINDYNGRVIGFSARIFPPGVQKKAEGVESEPAKYINTPQTILYDKSKVLYGLDKAKIAIRKENACIVVEGQMDALMAHQAGTEHVVAVSGTALTVHQLQALRRLSDTLLTSFDMDTAGESATRRSIDLALEIGFDVKAIAIPGSKDPADLVKEDPAIWREEVNKADNVISFFLKRSLARWDASQIEGKRNITKVMLPLIARIPQAVDKSHWVSKLAAHLSVKDDAVWEDLKNIKRESGTFPVVKETNQSTAQPEAPKTRVHILEERILGTVITHMSFIPSEVTENTFSYEPHKKIFAAYASLGDQERSKEHFLHTLNSEDTKLVANRLMFEAEMLVRKEEAEAEVVSCLREMSREQVKSRLEGLSRTIRHAEEVGAHDEVATLLKEFSEASKELNR